MSTTTRKGTNKTLIDAGGLASQLAAGLQDGRVKCAIDQYVAADTVEAGTIIELFGDLPVGAKIIAIILTISATTGSFTHQLGDTQDANRYALTGNTDLATALKPSIAMGKGYVIGTNTDDSQIELLTEGASLVDGTIIYGAVLYTTD